MTAPRQVWPYVHALLMALGQGAVGFLAGAFILGIPETKAGWLALIMGTTSAALARMFGVMLKKFGP